jgi:UrcA family protein
MKLVTKAQSESIPSVIAATLVALACLANGVSAQAGEPSQPLTKKITYSDLNLNSERGARKLFVRLRLAAQEVCTPYESVEFTRRRAWHSCVNDALASAVEKVNKPMVTALHNALVAKAG